MKDGEFTCFDDNLAKIKQLSEAEKRMITEIIPLCTLLAVLDPFLAISEDFNFKFSGGSIFSGGAFPRTPLVGSR